MYCKLYDLAVAICMSVPVNLLGFHLPLPRPSLQIPRPKPEVWL